MMMKSTHDNPILVTGAAGATGAIGRNLTAMLLAEGHKVRALVRREDERADALRRLGAEVVQGDVTDLASMHRRHRRRRAHLFRDVGLGGLSGAHG
jgi:nucleoside-diphosphate-sugar epimerase